MSAPVELKDGGICIRPEKMEKEKLLITVFNVTKSDVINE